MVTDTGWIDVPHSISEDEVQRDAGVSIRRVVPKYESPRQVRASYDETEQTLHVDFRYFGGPEPCRKVRMSDHISGITGRNSHRIYQLVFSGIPDSNSISQSVERAVAELHEAAKKVRTEVSRSNSIATWDVLSHVVRPGLPLSLSTAGSAI